MSWLSKLAFWRNDEPVIEHIDGYEVDGCFVPSDTTPDTQDLGDAACEIGEIENIVQPKSGPH